MKHFLVICLLVTPLLAPAQSITAPITVTTPAAGSKVVDIRFTVDGTLPVPEAEVRKLLALQIGGIFSDEAIEKDIRTLYATGWVDSVDVTPSEAPGGKLVTYAISVLRKIASIQVQGNVRKSAAMLLEDVPLAVGEPAYLYRLEKAAHAIIAKYATDGFPDATVRYEVQPVDKTTANAVFVVTEGPRLVIRELSIVGIKSFPFDDLPGTLYQKANTPCLPKDALQADVERILAYCQERGFLEAKIGATTRPVGRDDLYDLQYTVEEGIRYYVKEVRIEGNTLVSTNRLQPLVTLVPDGVWAISQQQATETAIADHYGDMGYIDARVETSRISADSGRITAVLRVTEGEKSTLRHVNVAGSHSIRESVTRREASEAGLREGGFIKTSSIKQFKKLIEGTRLFSEVDVRTNPTGTPGLKDVDINVTEAGTGLVNFGAGYTTIDGFNLAVDYTEPNFDLAPPNFRGGGIGLHIRLIADTQKGNMEIQVQSRDFFGRPLHLKLPEPTVDKGK